MTESKLIKEFNIDHKVYNLKIGKFGVYMESEGKSVNVYEDVAPDQLNDQKVLELFSQSEKRMNRLH